MSGLSAVLLAFIRLGAPFTDGVILQRDLPVSVWGKTAAGKRVTVSFAEHVLSATADAKGLWRVTLPPMKACAEGRPLTASVEKTGEKKTVSDVLVGEVWFAGGQSNMDVPLVGEKPRYRDGHGAAFTKITRMPTVRWNDRRNVWSALTPENLSTQTISAVAFYFARELKVALDVPIGLVCRHTGGLNIEQWISHRGYELNGELPQFRDWKRIPKEEWDSAKHAVGSIKYWSKQPSMTYENWIEPIAPFTCRGAIWYQGEQNAAETTDYDSKMDALLRGFEIAFDNPKLKFYFVQIPPPCATVGFPESQERFVRRHAADGRVKMAVINDVATPFETHTAEKEPVGRRLANLALRYDYGFTDLVADSPVAVSCRADGKRLHVALEHGEGLYIYNVRKSYESTFELAGADGVFKPAKIVNVKATKDWSGKDSLDGEIVSGEIVLESSEVATPVAARYMHRAPFVGNVFNAGNLPLAPFDLSCPRGER